VSEGDWKPSIPDARSRSRSPSSYLGGNTTGHMLLVPFTPQQSRGIAQLQRPGMHNGPRPVRRDDGIVWLSPLAEVAPAKYAGIESLGVSVTAHS
jgi:hypothetical protein